MNNFDLCISTEFVFGKQAQDNTAKMIKKYGGTNVFIHYGGGSVEKSGLLAKIIEQMENEGLSYVTMGGAQPNPIDTLVYKGIEVCRQNNIDFVLALGGGSTIDSAKAIAAGTTYNGDFWDFYEGKATIEKAIPVGTVLTIPAAGSESSKSSVITKTDGMLKRGVSSNFLRPQFAIMNPELTFTLPPYQTASGIVDMMAHVLERYFTNTQGVEISTRLCEATLLAVIEEAPKVMKNPKDYDARANMMWAGTIAHNGTCGIGRQEDWSSHALEHELSALYDCAHGAGLAVTFPAWMKYVVKNHVELFVRYAKNVWKIEDKATPLETALAGIAATEEFFASLGMPVTFAQLGAKEEDIDKLVAVLKINKGEVFGGLQKLTMEDARNIYRLACQ